MSKNIKNAWKIKVFLVFLLIWCYNTDRFVKGGILVSKVVVRNGNVDGALRTMKQKNARDGLLKKVREKQEGYKKPGVRRREKREQGIKNTRKRERYNH